MSKFLLTVCAFGLLLSSAFAEEKTPEQLREERSHIFGIEGLQTQTFTRFVAAVVHGLPSRNHTPARHYESIHNGLQDTPRVERWLLRTAQEVLAGLSALFWRLFQS
jgi:hypothetical protein